MKNQFFIKSIRVLLKDALRFAPRFFKYQLITKLAFSLAIIPLFWAAASLLITNRHDGLITDTTLSQFLFSPQGIVFSTLTLGLIFFGIVMEICGFIVISARAINRQAEASYARLVCYNIGLIPKLFGFGLFALIFYLLCVILLRQPSAELLNLSFLSWLRIPNFISEVIFQNQLYLITYILLVLVTLILSIAWVFSFHFITIYKMTSIKAMQASYRLIKHNSQRFFKLFLRLFLITTPVILLLGILWIALVTFLINTLNIDQFTHRVLMVFLLLLQQIGIILATMIIAPMQIHILTHIFYEFIGNQTDFKIKFPQISHKHTSSLVDRILNHKKLTAVAIVVILLGIAIPMSISFDYFFNTNYKIATIAHRAGGALAPENSLSGLKKAISLKANWAEVDIQRTRDGHYVINHDATFKRVAGANANYRSSELTLAQIRQLNLNHAQPNQSPEPVATLEDILKTAKNQIKLLLELKGATADTKMVDDVVNQLNEQQMSDQAVLITGNYQLIKYIKNRYPHIKTGLIYFLAFGQIDKLVADYIIIEEQRVRPQLINRAHAHGKKVFVWTINYEDDMKRLLQYPIDGIITDHPDRLMKILNQRSHKERLYSSFLNSFKLNKVTILKPKTNN